MVDSSILGSTRRLRRSRPERGVIGFFATGPDQSRIRVTHARRVLRASGREITPRRGLALGRRGKLQDLRWLSEAAAPRAVEWRDQADRASVGVPLSPV